MTGFAYDGDSGKIKGGTDETLIGNVGDRLKVDATNLAQSAAPYWSSKLRYIDMNATTGGVARLTAIPSSASWTTVYSYTVTSGPGGYIAGFIINVETFSTGWEFRLTVDGDEIFSFIDTDLTADAIYDIDDLTDINQALLGISKGSHDRLLWRPPASAVLHYTSSVKIEVRRQTASKKFQAGIIILSKEV